MKTLLALVPLFVLVSACTSQPAYRPASHSGFGYQETKIAENHFRVQTKVRNDNKDQAMNFALLRSAELTLLNGYDWFVVVDREKLVDRRESNLQATTTNTYAVRQDCGLLTCRSSTQVIPSTSISSGGPARKVTEVVLEIRFGKGIRPTSTESYDALEINDNLKAHAG